MGEGEGATEQVHSVVKSKAGGRQGRRGRERERERKRERERERE